MFGRFADMRTSWKQHPEADQQLITALTDPHKNWKHISEIVGYSVDACRMRARRMQYPGWDIARPDGIAISHVPPIVSIPETAARLPPADLWRKVEETTDRDVARHQTERLVDIVVPDTRPIGLTFASDQHIRQSGPIMIRRMREDAELVAITDGLYAALAGDGVDNHIKHREAMANGGDKPKDSWKLYDHYLGMFGEHKILALVSGNHDDWTRDFTGIDQVQRLAENRRVFYAPDEALLRFRVGDQFYHVLMRHQYRYNSTFNLGHTVKRLWEMGNDDFDIGVLGHHHEPACEPFVKHGMRRYAIRPGSYQFTSTFSRRKGFVHSYPTCPTVILWPDRRQLVGFWDVWEAASYLRLLREHWPASDLARPKAA